MPVERRLELAGFATRGLEIEGEGAPIVLLHGYADSADTWRLTLEHLERARRRALALDMPGFGAAGRLRPGPVLPQLDEFAAAAVEHVGQPAFVVGNSLGGCVALRIGERTDLDLLGVVPVAPAGLDHPTWFRIIEGDRLVRAVLASPLPLPQPVVRAVVGEAYRQLAFARPRAVAREVVSSFTHHHRDRRTVARYLATGRRLLAELESPFRLAEVRCPVLLVWGERDRMVPHRGARRVIEALPETTYELLSGCGHCPQIEEPDRFAELLLSFAATARSAA